MDCAATGSLQEPVLYFRLGVRKSCHDGTNIAWPAKQREVTNENGGAEGSHRDSELQRQEID